MKISSLQGEGNKKLPQIFDVSNNSGSQVFGTNQALVGFKQD